MFPKDVKTIEALGREYPYGFVTEIEEDSVPAGLSEDVIRTISAKKDEPEWMLEWRLRAYRQWLFLVIRHPPPLLCLTTMDSNPITRGTSNA